MLYNTYIAAWFSFENQAVFLFSEAMKNMIVKAKRKHKTTERNGLYG